MTPYQIINKAEYDYPIVARYVGFSGGNDSLAITHWMMENVPETIPIHINTGIGIEKTREYVRETCERFGWPLVEVFAKEDCGQDYEELVKEWGFPGPGHHGKMYARLKERCIRALVRESKTHRMDKVMIATGIRHDESSIRAGYSGREVDRIGAQVWVNPHYWWTKEDRDQYISENGLPTNPVCDVMGMSGECLCGAFAKEGEKELIKEVEPSTYNRIVRLENEVKERGFRWGWEGEPPKGKGPKIKETEVKNQYFCVDCNKAEKLINENHED